MWLTTTISDANVQLHGFRTVREDRDMKTCGKEKGGGLALYVNTREFGHAIFVIVYIPPRVDAEVCALELGDPLQRIFNRSLEQGRVPRQWKTTCIIPVPKKPHPGELNDYRPIALTAVASVLFYAVVCWGGSIKNKNASCLDKLVRKAGSVVGTELDSMLSVAG
ncbi:chymotrypsin-like elastase family member 2A [Labeo rohita]|uniref:Chymotrypsin-like elastase family member 2A n=1 Tax=Labeo rohita TaxID=84645 RepID=A0A498MAU9_LABRO|nr:chymotrypsin-like elastase family member 2A [Labeo rohita]